MTAPTDATHEEIKAAKTHAHVIEIKLDGEGVGAAIDAGHRAMLGQFEGPFVSVVMAGDGQMDPSDFGTLIAPVILGQAGPCQRQPLRTQCWYKQHACSPQGGQ
jgi:hypothetical protein